MTDAQADARRSTTRVLVVDDEPAVAEVLRRLLVKEGYSVDVCNDGQEALNAMPTVRPHLVLCDVNMPGITGIEVCRRLKQDPAYRLTPVVMVTGQAQREARLEGLDSRGRRLSRQAGRPAGADDPRALARPDQALHRRPRLGRVDHHRDGAPHRGARRQHRGPLPPDGQLRHRARPCAQPRRRGSAGAPPGRVPARHRHARDSRFPAAEDGAARPRRVRADEVPHDRW